jgi:hypothetical protein
VILLRAKGEPALAAESFQLGIDAKPPTELRTILESFRDQALQAAASQPPPPTP